MSRTVDTSLEGLGYTKHNFDYLKTEYEVLVGKYNSLTSVVDFLKKSSGEKDREIFSLKDQVSQMRDFASRNFEPHGSLSSTATDAKGHVLELEHENRELKGSLALFDEMVTENVDLKDRVAELEIELETLQEQSSISQTQLGVLRSELEAEFEEKKRNATQVAYLHLDQGARDALHLNAKFREELVSEGRFLDRVHQKFTSINEAESRIDEDMFAVQTTLDDRRRQIESLRREVEKQRQLVDEMNTSKGNVLRRSSVNAYLRSRKPRPQGRHTSDGVMRKKRVGNVREIQNPRAAMTQAEIRRIWDSSFVEPEDDGDEDSEPEDEDEGEHGISDRTNEVAGLLGFDPSEVPQRPKRQKRTRKRKKNGQQGRRTLTLKQRQQDLRELHMSLDLHSRSSALIASRHTTPQYQSRPTPLRLQPGQTQAERAIADAQLSSTSGPSSGWLMKKRGRGRGKGGGVTYVRAARPMASNSRGRGRGRRNAGVRRIAPVVLNALKGKRFLMP